MTTDQPNTDATPKTETDASEQLRERLSKLYPNAGKPATESAEPTDSEKLDLIGAGLLHGIEHHEWLVEAVRALAKNDQTIFDTVHSLGVAIDKDLVKLHNDFDEALGNLEGEMQVLNKNTMELLEDGDEDDDPSDTVVGRAWGFAVRCAGIGVLFVLVAWAITIVFPEGL